MLAVIKTGGKQYIVAPKEKIRTSPAAKTLKTSPIQKTLKAKSVLRIEKIDKKEGEELIFDQVLLLEKNNKVEVGTPFIKGAKVIGKILRQDKSKKVIVFKYKPKIHYKVKKGHRQPFTEVEIKEIQTTKP